MRAPTAERPARASSAATRSTELPLGLALCLGAGVGLAAMAATAVSDRALDPLISERQKALERKVREASPHAVAGKRLGARIVGHELDEAAERRARGVFVVAYGVLWGLIYGVARRWLPVFRYGFGLPFAVPFYALCDGVIAPRLGLTPPPQRVPWQLDAKELANHVAWTAAAEALWRASEKVASARSWT